MTFLEYAPAPESTAILDIKPSYGLFIGGEFVDARGDAFATISPSTEEHITTVGEANADDVDRAHRPDHSGALARTCRRRNDG